MSESPLPPDAFSFEKSLEALEDLILKLEKGDLSLEDSVQLFEKGMVLSSACQKALDEAEQKVTVLMQEDPAVPVD